MCGSEQGAILFGRVIDTAVVNALCVLRELLLWS